MYTEENSPYVDSVTKNPARLLRINKTAKIQVY